MNRESKKSENSSQLTVHSSRLQWFVLQTKPLEEDLVRQRLAHANIEVFYPRIKTAVRGAHGSHTRLKALFPAYLFAHMDLRDANLLHMIKYTRGVRKILGGDAPVPLPDVIIDTIKERIGDDDVVVQQMMLNKGDKVRIKSGWLEDLIGVLEKPVSSEGRVRVLLNIVNKCVRMEISSAEVEKIED